MVDFETTCFQLSQWWWEGLNLLALLMTDGLSLYRRLLELNERIGGQEVGIQSAWDKTQMLVQDQTSIKQVFLAVLG